MTNIVRLDDIYDNVRNRWFSWEKTKFSPSDVKGYRKFIKNGVNELEEFMYNDLSTLEWIDQNLNDFLESYVYQNTRLVYKVAKNGYSDYVLKKYLDNFKITQKDIDSGNIKLANCLITLIFDEEIDSGNWKNKALSDYADFVFKALKKEELKGFKTRVPTTKKNGFLPDKKNCPISVNLRKMI